MPTLQEKNLIQELLLIHEKIIVYCEKHFIPFSNYVLQIQNYMQQKIISTSDTSCFLKKEIGNSLAYLMEVEIYKLKQKILNFIQEYATIDRKHKHVLSLHNSSM